MTANAFTPRSELQTGESIEIKSRQYWIKIFGMLNQSYAKVDDTSDGRARIWFLNELGKVFDLIDSPSREAAEEDLSSSGWDLYTDDEFGFAGLPQRPFKWSSFSASGVYSSEDDKDFRKV